MADLNKEQTKAQQDLIDSQKGMSKRFKDLTSRLANVDAELGQNAANLRKNSKDTFIGMLKSKKLADVIRTQEADKFHRRIELEKIKEDINLKKVEDDGKKRTGLNEKQIEKDLASFAEIEKVRRGSIDSDQRALDERIQKQSIRGDAEKKDFEKLQSLRQSMLDAESSGAQSVRMANGQMQNMTDARKVLQEEEKSFLGKTNKVKELYIAEQEKINADIAKLEADKVDALVATTAETESVNSANTKALELHATNMEGIDNRETAQRDKFLKQQNDIMDDNSKFTGFSDALKDLTGGVIDLGGWADDATKFVNNVTTVFTTMGGVLMKIGKGLLAFVKNPMKYLTMAWTFLSNGMISIGKGFMAIGKRMIEGLKNFAMSAYTFLATGLKSMATGFVTIGKKLLMGAVRMGIAAASLVAGMLSAAASVLISGIVMLAPAILIGLAVAAIVFGVMYLAKKLEENKEMIMFKWGLIQEGFSIAIDGLILWKDKAVNFIGNVFEDIWMSIKSLFSAVLSGIENGINFAIQGINSFLPERMQLDEVDIGAKGMAAGLDEEKAALAIERDAEAVEFGERKDELDERKATVIENFKLDEVPKDGQPLSLEDAKAANAKSLSLENAQAVNAKSLSLENAQAVNAKSLSLENAQVVNAKSGEDISTATTEVNEGAKKGTGNSTINTGISADNSQVNHMNTSVTTVSPRDRDGTVGRLNLAVG